MTVFDAGRRFFDIRSTRANVDAAEANAVAQRFNVSLNVKQAFYNALAARESESAAQAQLEQAEQQLRASSARVQAGVATRSDSLRSAIQVGNAQLALLTARTNLESANATLTRLVATPYTVTANPADTVDQRVTLPDTAVLLDLAERGPAVDQARAQLTAARAVARSSWTTYLPTVTASFNRSATGPDAEFGRGLDYNYRSNVALGLTFPIFNQLNREEQRVQADVARANAQALLRDSRLAAQQQLVQATGALRTAEQRIAIQRASVEAAEEDLRVQSQRYAVGASTLLDVLTSQTQLNQARSALIQARYDYRVAKAQIEALIGREL
jgi:outer membrane protein